jgi:hypothetical protein
MVTCALDIRTSLEQFTQQFSTNFRPHASTSKAIDAANLFLSHSIIPSKHAFKSTTAFCGLLVHLHVTTVPIWTDLRDFQAQPSCQHIPVS